MRSLRPFLAALALLAAGRAPAVEYAFTYLSVPGRIDYVQYDYADPKPVPLTDNASFGAFGFIAVVPVPGDIGPFGAAVEAGFVLPAGDQAFDHRDLTKNGPTHETRHDGDFTSWSVTAVPILVAIRYSKPSENVTFGGEVGVGVSFLGVSMEQTLTTWDPTDTAVSSHETVRRQSVLLAPAVQAAAGLVVPASEGVDLRLYGGLVWLADVPMTTTSDATPPVQVYGATRDLPGLTIGGLGFLLRLALNVNL